MWETWFAPGAAVPVVAPRTLLTLASHPDTQLTPRVLQLGECIGRGQFGSVFRALDLSSGRTVAVKRILLAGKTESEIAALENEVALLQSLDHASVVRYEGVVRTASHVNIVLEFVENGSLHSTLKHFGALPEELVSSYAAKILDGLDYLHSRRVVHCDLKACNILTSKSGNVKLSDFGVSLNLAAAGKMSEVSGTPNWMAPEVIQLRGASTASDIWSLAATLVELTTGKAPYAEHNPMSALYMIVENGCPPLPPDASAEFRHFLELCFRQDPSQRPTAKQLMAHDWLRPHWNKALRDLKPMDSIPFLKRMSSEMTRNQLEQLSGLSLPPEASPRPPPARPTTLRQRLVSDVGHRRVSFELARPVFPQSYPKEVVGEDEDGGAGQEQPGREHTYVKTTFSRPVECRLCGIPARKQAVLCASCGLITHQHCAQQLGTASCDARIAQGAGWASSPQLTPILRCASRSPALSSPDSAQSFNPFSRWKKGSAGSEVGQLAKRLISPAGWSRASLSSPGGSMMDLTTTTAPSSRAHKGSSSSSDQNKSVSTPPTEVSSGSPPPTSSQSEPARPAMGRTKRISIQLTRTVSREPGPGGAGAGAGVAAKLKRRLSHKRSTSQPPILAPQQVGRQEGCKMQ